MPRRLKSALELVSDIGSKAFDLQHHSERDISEAVKLLREVNGPMFDWLVKQLTAAEAALASYGQHRDDCDKVFHSDDPEAATVYDCTCGFTQALAGKAE